MITVVTKPKSHEDRSVRLTLRMRNLGHEVEQLEDSEVILVVRRVEDAALDIDFRAAKAHVLEAALQPASREDVAAVELALRKGLRKRALQLVDAEELSTIRLHRQRLDVVKRRRAPGFVVLSVGVGCGIRVGVRVENICICAFTINITRKLFIERVPLAIFCSRDVRSPPNEKLERQPTRSVERCVLLFGVFSGCAGGAGAGSGR